MDQLLQHLVNGLVLGGTYALLGIGLTLIFGLMNVVNFAHGEFYTLGAYATFAALTLADLNFFAALGLAIVCGLVVGAVTELLLVRPLRRESIDTVMLVMIGVWIAMQNSELLVWGGVAKSIPHPFSTTPLTLGGVSLAPLRLFVLVAALGLIVGAHLLIHRTRLGRAMRATILDAAGYEVPRDAAVVAFDADALPSMLTVRARRRGDRLTPFGHGERRLKTLLIDAKIPRWERSRIPVIEAAGEIVWIGGLRRGAAAPLTERTRRVLQLALVPLAAG